MDLYLDSLVSREDYAVRKDEVEAKLAQLDRDPEEASRLPQVDDPLVTRSVDEFAEQARGKLATMGQEDMRVFLMRLLDEMVFGWQRGEVRMVGHIPANGGSQVLSELSGKHIPDNLCKNLLKFELQVPV